jgi:hypothetical protein
MNDEKPGGINSPNAAQRLSSGPVEGQRVVSNHCKRQLRLQNVFPANFLPH